MDFFPRNESHDAGKTTYLPEGASGLGGAQRVKGKESRQKIRRKNADRGRFTPVTIT
jgi:hypothetical protein